MVDGLFLFSFSIILVTRQEQGSRMSPSPSDPPHIPCSIGLLGLCVFLGVHSTLSKLVFSAVPEDSIGVLNQPLMLHCAAYDSSLQKVLPVAWEKDLRGTPVALGSKMHQMANGSLLFIQLQEEDLGTYTCSASTGFSNIRTTVSIYKADLEDVFFSPLSQTAQEGQLVFLQCVSGDSSPAAHITWLKDGKPLSRGTQIQGQYGGGNDKKTSGTLKIEHVSQEDEGVYVCVTHNPLLNISRESNMATLTLSDSDIDLEIVRGPENITVATETEAAFHCSVRGFHDPIVHWFKDGKSLGNESRQSLQHHGQLLIIRNVLEEDEGFYHCEVKNENDLVISKPAYLLPAVMEWTFQREPANATVKRGGEATLVCRPPASRPSATVNWFKNNWLLSPASHFSIEPNGDLFFHSVKDSDRGMYFCRATNSYLPRDVTSRKVYLEVLAPPSVSVWPSMLTAPIGAEVVIRCRVSGHPAPLIVWSKQGHSVMTGGKITIGVRNATLFISSVRRYDEGTYTCKAFNTMGQDERVATLRVAVSPVIMLFQKSVSSVVGSTVTLPCRAIGDLPITYTWTRGYQGSLSSSLPGHIDNNGTLHLLDIQWDAAGEYHCIAENLAGRDQLSTILSISAVEENPPDEDIVTFTSLTNISQQNTTNLNLSTDSDTRSDQQYDNYIRKSGALLKDSPINSETVSTSDIVTSFTLLPNSESSGYEKLEHYIGQPKSDTSKLSDFSDTSKLSDSIFQNTDRITPSPQPLEPNLIHTQTQPPTLHVTVSISSDQLTHLPTITPHNTGAQVSNNYLNTKPSFLNTQTPSLCLLPVESPTQTLSQITNPSTEFPPAPPSHPLLEKHDIPIVVGVGVSLAFIFITMAFYSLVQKNDSTAPTSRGAQRNFGVPPRHGERLVTGRTYDNRAFEDDNLVAVIEQSPNTSNTRPRDSTHSTSTLMMKPICNILDEVSAHKDLPVIVETHQSQQESISEEQTPQPSATPVHHSINISHASSSSSSLLLSNCVSLGVTTVAVHFFPSAVVATTHSTPPVLSQEVGFQMATAVSEPEQQNTHILHPGPS
ncbi:hemicentin-1 isoform X2 [Alosa sapidissima]|uniref:hemicentin-1 isoform X2 n=1 Tax=Alosa sapidissima TaxID=34773 RepID=UPI001C0A1C12|nr:hemicentin-1 isoform X2 [Alosa sapidissima]